MLIPNPATLLHAIHDRAAHTPDARALVYEPSEGPAQELTCADLWARVSSAANQLSTLSAAGDRIVLLFPSGPQFVEAFLGCILSRRIAVPAAVPRNERALERTAAIVRDAGSRLVITTPELQPKLENLLEQIHLPNGDATRLAALKADESGRNEYPLSCSTDDIAFLQYTSGSTAHPKGVIVGNENLISNLRHIYKEFGFQHPNCLVNWLPIYHDMGLIGGILAPLFAGAPTVLMSPAEFVQRPVKWLQLITKYGGTISGGPNFAYDACVARIADSQLAELDLQTWRIAFNGSEPIRADTLKRFQRKFKECGFDSRAIFPCYGLAESTLLVTCRDQEPYLEATFDREELKRGSAIDAELGRVVVACGPTNDEYDLAIVDPATRQRCDEHQVGEIWIRGSSVCRGYWGQERETAATFQAELANGSAGGFLRTGDLGVLHGGQLYVTGRLKNIVIIRGLNYACEDIEDLAQGSHPTLTGSPVAAFGIEGSGGEQLVVAQEISRRHLEALNSSEVRAAIQESIVLHYGIRAHDIVLVTPGALPRTTSGKIQRFKARELYLADALPRLPVRVHGSADLRRISN